MANVVLPGRLGTTFGCSRRMIMGISLAIFGAIPRRRDFTCLGSREVKSGFFGTSYRFGGEIGGISGFRDAAFRFLFFRFYRGLRTTK